MDSKKHWLHNYISHIILTIRGILSSKEVRKSALNRLSLFMKGGLLLNEVSNIEKSNGYLISQKYHNLICQFDRYDNLFEEVYTFRKYLTKEEFSRAEDLHSSMNVKKDVIKNYNKNFIGERLKTHKLFFDGNDDGLERSLDEQQRLAVVKDDKHNLVIAGAGSGKTAVITSQIVYLLRRRDYIRPEKILVLAFNKLAAREIRNRLKKEYNIDSVNVRTFHSFGFSVINENSSDQPGVLDDSKRRTRIRSIFTEQTKNKRFQNLLIEYFGKYLDEELDETSFSRKEEYYWYVRNKQYTTLNGEKVKSVSERDIANFLFKHNIRFFYESVVRWTDKDDHHRVYTPDFYLPDYDIYIEHWGVDEKGDIPSWFEISKEKYHEKIEWARKQFKKHNKILIETF